MPLVFTPRLEENKGPHSLPIFFPRLRLGVLEPSYTLYIHIEIEIRGCLLMDYSE